MLTSVSCALLALAVAPSPARITTVTVYPDRAEVTRETSVRAASGPQQILIGPLPVEMDDRSLRVSGRAPDGAALTLGDVEVRTIPGIEVRGPELEAAEAELASLQGEAAALDDRLARIARLRDLLGSLQSASASQFAKEMASTELRPQTWQGAYDFLRRNLDGLSDEERSTKRERAGLAVRIDVAHNKVAGLKARRTLAHKVVAVGLASERETALTLQVRYAQPGASWEPCYEAVIDPDTGRVTLAMFAWVRQTTGERWDDVRLTLATGAPALGIDLPSLASLGLARPGRAGRTPIIGYNLSPGIIEELEVITSGASAEFGRADGGFGDVLKLAPGVTDTDHDGNPNVHGARDTGLLRTDGGNLSLIAQQIARPRQQETVTTFDVPGALALDPDGQPRRVAVSRETLEGRRAYLVIPSVRPAAFMLARVTAPDGHPLLAGKVSHYIGATLVGSSTLPAVAPGEEFVLSFGTDERVKVELPALPRLTSERGGRRTTACVRRVMLTNRTGGAIDLDVKERVPVSTDDAIRVSVDDATTAGFELKENEPGIYTWRLAMAPDEAKEITLAYSVRHPSSMTLASLW